MSRFLTSFWRQPQPEAVDENGYPEAGGDSSLSQGVATGASSWIIMREGRGASGGSPVMAVNQGTVKRVLEPLGDKDAVNVVAIFGAARGGKSFLMNQLAGRDDIFKISNDKVGQTRQAGKQSVSNIAAQHSSSVSSSLPYALCTAASMLPQ